MAKKLNPKIVIILLVIMGIGALGAGGLGFYYLRERNPEYCLEKAERALENNDYKTAERYFGRACGVAKSNRQKIENYFRFAEFQLLQNEHHEADWSKALGCWNTVLKVDPKNQEALQKLFDYFYEIADLGQSSFWKQVQEYSEKLLDVRHEENLPEDPELYLAHGRACLDIARAGGTTNRQELLDQAVADFQKYAELRPGDEKGYLYLAESAFVQGMIEVSRGNLQARDTATTQAAEYLQQGVENTEDKATAWAHQLDFTLRTLSDPNQIEPIRAQIEDLISTLPPDDDLYMLLSRAYYEHPGPLSRKEELSRAIEAVRQALQIDPENVPYTLRLANLVYREGSIYKDPDAIQEAIQIAEEGLSLPDAQERPGPRQFYARGNQYALLSLIAQIHLDRILEAGPTGMPEAEKNRRLQRVKSATEKIAQIIGTTENPTAQKWQGLIALAEGEEVKAIRQLYNAYEQSKALDQPNQRSQIDPYLCYVLASQMADRNVFGMQREFLEKALINQNSISTLKPKAWIDYAKLLLVGRNFREAIMLILGYENAYGSTPETEALRLQAYIDAGFIEEAEEIISAMDPAKPETIKLQLLLTNQKIFNAQVRLSREDSETEAGISEEELRANLDQWNRDLSGLFKKLLAADITQADEGLLAAVSQRTIRDGRIDEARQLVSAGLRSHPRNQALLFLQKQLEQPDPQSIPDEQLDALRKEVIEQIQDPTQRLLSLARYYQSHGQLPEALDLYRQAYEANPDDPEVARAYFEILLGQKEFGQAEQIARKAREKNLDGCEGSFFAAQLEMSREDYPLALRRLDESLTYRPMFPQAWLLKSRVFYLQDELPQAIESARTAHRMNPLNPEIVLHYASILNERNQRLGNKATAEQSQEAEQLLLAAMILNPANRNLQSFYSEITYEKDPEKSLAMRQRLLETEPTVSNAVLLGSMAMRMARSETDRAKEEGLYQVAGRAYQKALEIAPDNEGVLNAYAEYMRQTGKTGQAETMLENQPELLWRFYLRDGQYDKAEETLLALRGENPENQNLVRGLIYVAQGKGDRQALRKYLDTLLPMATTADEELWALQRYLEYEFTESIEDQIASFRERYPENTHVLLLEAWYQLSRGQLEEALSQLNQFLAATPEHASAWRLRGRIHRLLGDYPKAVDDLLRSQGIDPQPITRIELANVYLENNQTEAAIGELRSGLNEPQAPIQIRSMLESIYEKRNRVTDLKNFYRETLEKYPDSVHWHFRAGKFLYDQKEYAEAEALLAKAWELSRQQGLGDARTLDYYLETLLLSKSYNKLLAFAAEHIDTPFAPFLYTYTAQTHLELGQKEKAAQNFYTALDKTGTNLDLMNGIVSIIVEKTGPDVVVQWCQQKFSQNPKSVEGLLAAINLYSQLGQYNKALQAIDTCLELLDPQQNQWLLLSLKKANIYTMAYAQTSDDQYLEQSIAQMEKIIELMPYNYSAMNNLAYLLANNNQQLDKALEYSRKACQNELGNPVYLDTYAYIQCLTGEYEDAYQSLLRTIQLHEARNEPVPWEVYKHIGMAQEGLGKTNEAIQAYQRSMEAAGIPAKEKEELENKIQELYAAI